MHISGLFDKKVYIQSGKVDIEDAKVYIQSTKVDIEDAKVDIRKKLLSSSSKVTDKTINHVLNIFVECGKDICFGRTMVEDITGLKTSGASKLIKLLVDNNVITPVTGQGKGKYRFR